MLPSTGYFKAINCPFYDSGLCERPYCHFRHAKKESLGSTSSDGIESGAILQKLVTAAVQKVLQQTEAPAPITQLTTAEKPSVINTVNNPQYKATYNPTPIAELNKIVGAVDTEAEDDVTEQRKKHIPVPYTPRKPTSLPVKRSVESNGSKSFIYLPPPATYTPDYGDSALLDKYTPKRSTESHETYIPGIDKDLPEYSPHETQPTSKHNYVPTERNIHKKKVLEYKPTKLNCKSELPTVTYQPTPKALVPCFSSDEDEPDLKKQKLNHDLNGLDDLGAEFDILDQILDEEKHESKSEPVTKSEVSQNKQSSHEKTSEKPREVDSKKHKSSSDKHDYKRHDKSKSTKDKHSSHSKSDKKSHHKSSSKPKSREESKDKYAENKKKSNSKSSEKNSKHSENSSSKSSSKHSKHSSSSGHNSKKSDRKSSHHKSKKHEDDKAKKHQRKDPENVVLSDVDSSLNISNMEIDQNYDSDVISESDEEAIALECKRIFEEYVPTEKPVSKAEETSNNPTSENCNIEEYIPGKKRISRTAEQNVKVAPKAPLKPDYKGSAARIMAERLVKIKEFHTARSTQESSSADNQIVKPDFSKNLPTTTSSKIRIAHVPYASTMINAKKIITPNPKLSTKEPSTSSTVIQTVKRGAQRIAHIPSEKFIDRPGVLEPLASKIAANIRSTYLNMMIDECLKIYLSATDAYARAQHEELMTSKKCSTVQIYKNSAVLTVSRLRKELQECNGVKKSGSDCTMLQKMPQTISGSSSNLGSWSIESKNRRISANSQEFIGAKFYNNIKKWVLTEQQLQDNGFPRPHSSGIKGRAIIYGQNKKTPPKGFIRTCCRCKKEYTVDKKGFPVIKEECIYHPNNKYRIRGEVKYQCCGQDTSSDGCCIAPCHVYEYVDFENLKGYIRTMPPESKMDDYGVYSLDCEMCYTTQGLDLTRVTVINSACKVVYETLIKPLHPIMDYNTRYSGITEEQMANVKTTLLDVQATLLTMFNSKTILVGHSLESDFKALKLIHDTVVDTSVLFPHKMGPPYKRALRNLSSEYLKKIIQNSVDGHDSAEDATVCMELIIYKLKEDLKTR